MNIIISNTSDEPIYQQIVTQLKQNIVRGKLTAGQPLPSIRSLAKDLKISVITTKRAYEELEKEGLIETVAGKGSFIAQQKPELLQEKKRSIIESKVYDLIKECKALDVSLEELQQMVLLLYEEDK